MRPIVDTHFHLQDLERHVYPWLDPNSTPPDVFGEDFGQLRRSYRIEDYLADVAGLGIRKAVHVENGVSSAEAVTETLCHTTFNLKNLKPAISMTYRSTRYLINDMLLDNFAHLPTSYLRIVS